MSPWTEFVKMHINKCPGATPQARMRACAAKYRSRRHNGGKRAGIVGSVGCKQGTDMPYDWRHAMQTAMPKKRAAGVKSIMPARQGVGLHVGRGVGRKRKPRSQQALAAAIHGLMRHR
jgi:hypothetical protein